MWQEYQSLSDAMAANPDTEPILGLGGGNPLFRGLSGRSKETFGEAGVLGADPVDLGAVDREHDTVGEGAHTSRAPGVLGDERPLADHGSRPELVFALRRFDDDRAVDHHIEAGARLAVLDQDLSGRELDSRPDCLEPLQIVLVHACEYRIGVASCPGPILWT